MRRFVIHPALLACPLVFACSSEPSSRNPIETGIGDGDDDATSGDGDGDGDGPGPGDGDGDGEPTGEGDGDGEPTTGDGDGIKFDLSPLPDTGDGPVLPTIPETCDQALMIESTVGCEFRANKMQNFQEEPTSLVVGNVSDTEVANVEVYFFAGGAEQLVAGPIPVAPGGTYEYVMNMPS